jgi:hypothetical protein
VAHLLEQRYSKKAVRRDASFSYPGLALQNEQQRRRSGAAFFSGNFGIISVLAPPLEQEDEKPKISGPTKESVTKLLVKKSKPQEGEEVRSRHRQVTKHIPRVKDEWSQRN